MRVYTTAFQLLTACARARLIVLSNNSFGLTKDESITCHGSIASLVVCAVVTN